MTGALNEKQVFVGAASVIELMHHISGDEIVLCAVDKEHRHLCVADALDCVDLFEIVFCDMFIEEVRAVEQRRSRNMGVFELIIELCPRAGIAAVGNGEFDILRQVGVAAHHHNGGAAH